MNRPEIITTPVLTDLPLLARCHRKSFPKALSTAMGQAYVEKMLEWYIVDDHAFLFYLKMGERCVGYCGGLLADGQRVKGSASSMIQYSFNKALVSILIRPWLLFHAEFLKKYKLVIKNVWRRFTRVFIKYENIKSVNSSIPPHTGLIVIGVDPAYQGKGYGSMLLAEFENQSKLRKYNYMMLTVLQSNKTAIESYKRNGWEITRYMGNALAMEKRIEV